MIKANFSKILFLLGISLLLQNMLFAQKENAIKNLDPRELDEYKENAGYIVSVLQQYFNIVGDSASSFSDKKVIFNESYQKLFRDSKVQVEDDLSPERKHIIYKDINAYLKDIDFFFKHAEFQFELKEIQALLNDKAALFLKVDLIQKLEAIGLDDEVIQQESDRFLEISVDLEEHSLKIVSIYSNKVNADFNLLHWWQSLSKNWQIFFAKKIHISDTLLLSDLIIDKDSIDYSEAVLWLNTEKDSSLNFDTLYFSTPYLQNQIRKITLSDALSISGDTSLLNLKALRVFNNLQYLDISNTKIQDLAPIRHLSDLKILNASYSLVSDISPLQYNSGLKHLNLSFTLIQDLEILHRFINLEKLDISNTYPKNIKGIENLRILKELDLSNMQLPQEEYLRIKNLQALDFLKLANSNINDLSPLAELKKLSRLDIRNTKISDITPLSSCTALEILNLEGTDLSSLLPLIVLPNIKKIYCDNTRISKKLAYDFMARKPQVLVVHNSKYLFSWWQSLSSQWKEILAPEIKEGEPNKEQLQEIASRSKINISGRKDIESISAISILENLSVLNISATNVTDLSPISELRNLQYLDISHSKVGDLLPVQQKDKMQTLKMEGCSLGSILALKELKNLQLIYADSSNISQAEIDSLAGYNANLVVIHNSLIYQDWWNNLETDWKHFLADPLSLPLELSDMALFKIVFQRKLSIKGNRSISYIEPLKKLRYLKELEVSQTAVKDLEALSKLYFLEKLSFTDGPLENIEALSNLRRLNYLNLSNTPVQKLSVLEYLPNLKQLIVAGTSIKNLKALSDMQNLEILDCSNTSLRNLKAIEGLEKLKLITCYNTRISASYIRSFKIKQADVKLVYY